MALRKCLLLNVLLLTGYLSAGQPDQITLAVSELHAQGVQESDAAVVSEQLRVEIARHPRIRLVERGQMQEILKEQGFQQSGCASDACAVEVGQLLGVKHIVVGSVGAAGSFTLLTVRLIDVATGSVLFNEAVRTQGGIDKLIDKGIGEISTMLHKSLFPSNVISQSTTEKPARRPGRGILIGGLSAAVVGGGVAALVILTKSEEPAAQENYTEIYLP